MAAAGNGASGSGSAALERLNVPQIKLAKLPDRTPVKLTIAVSPELYQTLEDYARVYADTYGHTEPIAELAPAMLAGFLEADKAFARRRRDLHHQ